jgi:hypothetical protein
MCKFIRHIIWLLSPRKTVYGYMSRQLERAMLDEVGSFPAQPESEER